MCAAAPKISVPDVPPPPPPPPQYADASVFGVMSRARKAGQTIATSTQGAPGKPALATPSLMSGGPMISSQSALGGGG